MIKFMVEVHRRKRRIIEEYEKKEAVRVFDCTFLLKTHINDLM
jgi:hypothetical protein